MPDLRPRVLYVEPLGVRGGMGHYNEALAAAYTRLGAKVELVTGSADLAGGDGDRPRVSAAFRLATDRSRPRPLRAMGYVAGYLSCLPRVHRGDLVVIHFLHLPAIDLQAARAFRRRGAKLVLVAHEPQPIQDSQRGSSYLRALRAFDIVVVHGARAREDVIGLGVDADRVHVAGLGDYAPATPLDRASASGILGIDLPESPVAAIIGNLRPNKGVRPAREALDTPDGPARTLLVAGARQGAWDLDEALATTEGSGLAIAKALRRMSDLEELAAYSLADVVLALYETAYSSAVISRAHALGRPVVMTDVGDLKEQAAARDVVVPRDYTAAQLREAVARCLAAGIEVPTTWNLDSWLAHAAGVLERAR
jgi:hypothetical protein